MLGFLSNRKCYARKLYLDLLECVHISSCHSSKFGKTDQKVYLVETMGFSRSINLVQILDVRRRLMQDPQRVPVHQLVDLQFCFFPLELPPKKHDSMLCTAQAQIQPLAWTA